MPRAPALETAAASSATAAMGAWTIGLSMPSTSQMGVRIMTTSWFGYDWYDVGIDCCARLFHP